MLAPPMSALAHLLLTTLLAAPAPYVRVHGTQLVLEGRPFQFVGANVGVMHGESQRRRYRRTLAAAHKDGLRVVRIWAFGEQPARSPAWHRRWIAFRAGPRGWIPAAGRQLDRVLAEAGRLGLRVILVLGNNWGDYGGIPQYLRWAKLGAGAGFGALDRFYRNPRTRAWYRMHVTRLLGRRNAVTGRRYAADPTILSWELLNESSVSQRGFAGRRRFVRETAALIHRYAPNHLVGSGVTGYGSLVRRTEWLRVCRLPGVSYCDAHLYPEESWRLQRPRNLDEQIDDRAQLARYVAHKPILFGEFGFSAALKKRHDLGAGSHRPPRWWMDRFLRRARFDGAAGALVWIYLSHCHEKRRFPIWVDRPASRPIRRTIRRWAHRYAAGPASRTNPRLNARHGTRPMYTPQFTVRRPWPRNLRWERVPRGWRLRIPVQRFVRGRFLGMGHYDRGRVAHVWGEGHGFWEYPVPRLPAGVHRLSITLRLSSEYPGSSAPPDGTSPVVVSLGRTRLGRIQAAPDDGLGTPVTLRVVAPAALHRLRRGRTRLRLEVPAGPKSHGLCVYGALGTRGRRAPQNIHGRTGPLLLLAEIK